MKAVFLFCGLVYEDCLTLAVPNTLNNRSDMEVLMKDRLTGSLTTMAPPSAQDGLRYLELLMKYGVGRCEDPRDSFTGYSLSGLAI